MLSILLLLFSVCSAIGRPSASFNVDPYIINGVNANETDFPYVASLRYVGGGHVCGASIITRDWLLTAAHCCLNGYPLAVYVGSIYISEGGQTYPIRKYVPHEKFNMNDRMKNDICLINVGMSITYNDRVGPVALPHKDFILPENASMIIPGWGVSSTGEGAQISDRLQFLTGVIALTNQECASKTDLEIIDGQLCAFAGPNRSTCSGDAGGPLTYKGVQVGLSSSSFQPCSMTGMPDIFTRITIYVDWINQVLGQSAEELTYSVGN